jgi:hypothetical protein
MENSGNTVAGLLLGMTLASLSLGGRPSAAPAQTAGHGSDSIAVNVGGVIEAR